MDYEPIQIEHGDDIHFYRITPQGMWMWKRISEKDINLVFSVNVPDGFIDSTPFYVKNGIGSFKMYFPKLQDVKDVMEYQLNTKLLDEAFEVYDAMVLAQVINGELQT